MYNHIFLCLTGLSATLTDGFGHFGNIEIEENDAAVDDNLLIVVSKNECNFNEIGGDIHSAITQRFNCLEHRMDVVGPHLTASFFDSSSVGCVETIDDISVDFSDLCIVGASFDGQGQFDSSGICTSRGTTDTDLASISSWGVDGLDGTYNDQFTYYDLSSSVDIYILDTGIRTTHEEFGGRATTLAAYAGVEYWNDNYSPAYHGTSCASTAGGNSYGSSQGQNIYSVNMAGVNDFGGYGSLYPSTCFTLLGLQDSLNNMINTGRRGVLSMSFSISFTESQLAIFEDIAQSIIDFGGILVAAAGNSNSASCGYPASSDKVLSVGAYDESLNIAYFSNWGDCVDVYGPGAAHHAASITTDNSYHDVYGTSFSSPAIAGVISNMLSECQDTGYEDPCTMTALKSRFKDPSVTLNDLYGYRCIDPQCNGIKYQCGASVFPRPLSPCINSPCLEDEAGNCQVYHDNTGCSQCESGYFKKSFDFPCVSCTDTFGEACLHCQDWNGCGQCRANDFTRVYDNDSGLYYCEPSPCIDDDNKCQVCNNGLCSQCVWPYTLNPDQKSCS